MTFPKINKQENPLNYPLIPISPESGTGIFRFYLETPHLLYHHCYRLVQLLIISYLDDGHSHFTNFLLAVCASHNSQSYFPKNKLEQSLQPQDTN